MLSRLLGSLVLLLLLVAPAIAGDDTPVWLQQVAAARTPEYEKDVPAVVLHKEQHTTVTSDGRIVTETSFAVRILLREGRRFAVAREYYESDAGKVRDMHAWLIRPSVPVKKYGKDQTIDAIEDANDVYNESRYKAIDASDDADAGSIFGYETRTEER